MSAVTTSGNYRAKPLLEGTPKEALRDAHYMVDTLKLDSAYIRRNLQNRYSDRAIQYASLDAKNLSEHWLTVSNAYPMPATADAEKKLNDKLFGHRITTADLKAKLAEKSNNMRNVEARSTEGIAYF